MCRKGTANEENSPFVLCKILQIPCRHQFYKKFYTPVRAVSLPLQPNYYC